MEEDFEVSVLHERPMPVSIARPVQPYHPPDAHWATGTPQLPPDTQLLLVPCLEKTPWAQLAAPGNEVRPCYSRVCTGALGAQRGGTARW